MRSQVSFQEEVNIWAAMPPYLVSWDSEGGRLTKRPHVYGRGMLHGHGSRMFQVQGNVILEGYGHRILLDQSHRMSWEPGHSIYRDPGAGIQKSYPRYI